MLCESVVRIGADVRTVLVHWDSGNAQRILERGLGIDVHKCVHKYSRCLQYDDAVFAFLFQFPKI